MGQQSGLTPTELIEIALNIVLVIASIILFFNLILGGIKYITSGGDTKKTEAARSQITVVIIGLIIVSATYFILTFISSVFF